MIVIDERIISMHSHACSLNTSIKMESMGHPGDYGSFVMSSFMK